MVEGRTYKPVILEDRCDTCGVCVRECPAEVAPEYREEPSSLRAAVYSGKVKPLPLPSETAYPPCQEACPIHQDTKGYAALIARGRFSEALELIRASNPLPAICGYVCHHPCEDACARGAVDEPVPLRLLKRFVAEYEGKQSPGKGKKPARRRGKVLVAGSGPAGLAAANDLSLLGYKVTVMEALPVLGGMLTVGIPEFRLPREIIQAEIRRIQDLGVEMKPNSTFRLDGGAKSLSALGYDAAFLAFGAHRSAKLGIPGEERKGIWYGVEFLREVNLGRKPELGNKIAVIGGGNVAVDAARTARRLGAKEVEIYYRRSKKEMPAIPEEVDEALREGVRIHFQTAPVEIRGKAGKKAVMEFSRMKLGEPDETGRRRPVPIAGSRFRVQADAVIAAIGQRTDRKQLKGLDLNKDGTICVDSATGLTCLPGIFAGGDAVTGPGWAIDAVRAGKKAAESIHRYLS